MAWFRGRLYVGTTRHVLRERKKDGKLNPETFHRRAVQPSLDQRAQIWRYDPQTNRWEKIFISPVIGLPDGTEVPRDIGYRAMTVFQGLSDPAPALYVSTISTFGGLILRSEDGEHFDPVSKPGLGNPNNRSFRTLVPFHERLYTSPTGRTGAELIERNLTETPIVYENSDPRDAPWRAVSEIGFGDPTNTCIFEMVSLNDCLFAGTFNPYRGFQVWKTHAQGFPHRWNKVVIDGGFRGNANESVASMVAFRNALYIGTGIQGLGYDKAYNAGSAAAELIRIYPNDSWELIIGEPRRTFEGIKYPVSGLGPGFDNKYNSVVWRMVEHDGWLYAGTNDWSLFLSFLKPYCTTPRARPWGEAIDNLIQEEGGFDLWKSRDGTRWELVTCVGFGNPHNYGLRTMVSTPVGLFVGTVGMPRPIVAEDEEKPAHFEGGCEVWLGR